MGKGTNSRALRASSFPKENLMEFSGGENEFSGPLPESIVRLGQPGTLDLHRNEISDGIGNLSVLNYLDLSGNRFSGKIPFGLQNMKLNVFNLSNNRLSGELPPLIAKEIYRSSFLGNLDFCGDLDGLCDGRAEAKSQGYMWLLRCIFIISGLVFVVGVVWFYLKYKNFKKADRTIDKSK